MVLKYPYYPGCTLFEKAAHYDRSARKVAEALEITLEELEEWQCCGAVYPLASDSLFPMAAPLRNMVQAEKVGDSMVTLCSACYNVHKRVSHLVDTDEETLKRINSYNREDEYKGGVEVLHLLEIFHDEKIRAKIEGEVKKDLTGLKVGAYYGCLLLRPEEVMAFDDPEDPNIFEDLLSSLGCEAVKYPYRIECCGAFATVHLKRPPKRPVEAIVESAQKRGISLLVVSCPLCHYNLKESQEELAKDDPGFEVLPVIYFTELMEYAFGLKEELEGVKTLNCKSLS